MAKTMKRKRKLLLTIARIMVAPPKTCR
jgi:hypothetical protein